MNLRRLSVLEEVDAALSELYEAARRAAEHAPGVPIGRSRSVDLRRLATAVQRLSELAEDPRLHVAAARRHQQLSTSR